MSVSQNPFYDRIKEKCPSMRFMDETLTDMSILEKSSEAKHIMEMLCFCIQLQVCRELEKLEPTAKFKVDRWFKPNNAGGGVTCVLQGDVIEKGGVNISVITGELTPQNIQQMKSRGHDFDDSYNNFVAVGISSVLHPRNPHCPTMHFNYRYFEVSSKNLSSKPVWWFGGGCDITPYYVVHEDVKHFHTTQKLACDKHDADYYTRFKKWADDYFYIPHRNERRGLGGIFFDDLCSKSQENILDFVFDCAFAIVPSYIPILARNKDASYGEREREWQLVRRGRYVEFNIMYDRGTKFGLAVPGSRIESIMMTLPLYAKWEYCSTPEPGSKEEELIKYTQYPIEWVA